VTRWTAKFKNQREVEESSQQAKEVTRTSAPKTVAFHGTAPASFSGHEAAAPSLPEAGGFGGLRAQQMTRERGRDIGRGRRMDGGDEDARVSSGEEDERMGKENPCFFSFFALFFSFVVFILYNEICKNFFRKNRATSLANAGRWTALSH
jgi:hypothetical protein